MTHICRRSVHVVAHLKRGVNMESILINCDLVCASSTIARFTAQPCVLSDEVLVMRVEDDAEWYDIPWDP